MWNSDVSTSKLRLTCWIGKIIVIDGNLHFPKLQVKLVTIYDKHLSFRTYIQVKSQLEMGYLYQDLSQWSSASSDKYHDST